MSERQQTQQSKKPDSTFQKQAILTSQVHVSHPASIIQRARIDPKSLTPADVLQLQRTIGNRAVGRLLSEIRNSSKVQQAPIQQQKLEHEETCPSCMQKQEIPEEEEPLQGKFETIQRLEPEEEENLQMKSVVQRQEIPEEEEPLQTKKENNTGMPDNLKAGVENLSGTDMSDVRVHYNSSKPAEVGALAYTQGTNIHVAPGQERHLPHEAWHVVQQKQERVKPTMQLKGLMVNDDKGLEREADVIGRKAIDLTHGDMVLKGSSQKGKTSLQACIGRTKEMKLTDKFTVNAQSIIQRLEFTSSNGNKANVTEGEIVQKLHEWMIERVKNDKQTTSPINLKEYFGPQGSISYAPMFTGGHPRKVENVSDMYTLLLDVRKKPGYTFRLQHLPTQPNSCSQIASHRLTSTNTDGMVYPASNLDEKVMGEGVS